jgi:uncharacterized protein (TIGR03067 family)
MRRLTLTLAFVLLTVAFAPAPLPRRDARGGGGPAMEGRWEGLLVTGNSLTYHPGTSHPMRYELRVNLSARPPTYDIRGGTGSSVQGRSYLGIYKVEGDTLTICYNEEAKGRPSAFDGPGKGQFTESFKRVR